MHARVRAFVEVTPNLESRLTAEISSLRVPKTTSNHQLKINDAVRGSGGIELECTLEQIWWIIHRSKLAGSVRLRIGAPCQVPFPKDFEKGFSKLQKQIQDYLPYLSLAARKSKIDVKTYLPQISVTCRSSTVYHTGLVKEIVLKQLRQSIYSKLKYDVLAPEEESEDEEIPKLFVRIDNNTAQVSLDVGGMLYRRTKDKHVSNAPLRETLAAACLFAAQYSQDKVLWDPFCGAGTILLEAMRWNSLNSILDNQFTFRTYPFQQWTNHPNQEYDEFLERMKQYQQEVDNELLQHNGIRFVGTDIATSCISASQHNISTLDERLQKQAKFVKCPFHELDPALINHNNVMIVTNAPYGIRLDNSPQLLKTFETFGTFLKTHPNLK